MWNRSILLASLSASLLLGGCVIHTGPGKNNNRRRSQAPPPPPAKVQPATPPAQTPPAQQTPPPAKTPFYPGFKFPPRTTTPPPVQQTGSLLVTVADGTCDIGIDGQSYGVQQRVDQQVAAGVHTVTCAPATGALQSKQATVAVGNVTTVVFQLATPGNSRVTLPTNIAPPVGRPTPQ